jgi:serine/threonine protein kinase
VIKKEGFLIFIVFFYDVVIFFVLFCIFRYSFAADVFSLGVMMYVLIFKEFPFDSTQLLLPSTPSIKQIPSEYGEEIGELIKKMLDFVCFFCF